MAKAGGIVIGAMVGAAVAALAVLLAFPAVDPSIWREVASATGIRGDGAITPVLWRTLVGAGVPLKVIGAVGIGLFACAFFDALRRTLLILVPAAEFPKWWTRTVPLAAFAGTLLAVFADPVWRLALTGGPALVELALMAASVDLYLTRFFVCTDVDPQLLEENEAMLRRVSLKANAGAYAAFLIAGALVIETPVALVLPVGFVLVHALMRVRGVGEAYKGLPDGRMIGVPPRFASWGAFLLWATGAVAVYATAAVQFEGGMFLKYLAGVFLATVGAAGVFGWMLWAGFAFAPCIAALGVLPALTRDGRRLEFAFGLVALISGLVAYGQVSPFASTRFWCFLDGVRTVSSPLMLALGAVLAAVAVAATFALFAYFAFHLMPEDYPVRKPLAWGVGVGLALVVCGTAATVVCEEARRVRAVIAAAMDETARECEGLTWVFTDGTCDAGVELAARARGRTLYALPMIAREDGNSAALRTRGLADEADRKSAETGVAVLLRDWATAGSTNLNAAAVQLGLEFWKRERKAIPEASGLVARPGGYAAGERERGIAEAGRLADAMLALAKSGAVECDGDTRVREAFAAVLWRLSRMARARGDIERADELDEANIVLKHMLDAARRERNAAFMQMTDEEGLAIALKRADFTEARRFAFGVLKRNPKSAAANFGVGMNYLLENKLDGALPYLEAAHAVQPDEPAFLNNLAILYMKKGKLDTALRYAEEAAKLAPDVPEVKETLKRVREARGTK